MPRYYRRRSRSYYRGGRSKYSSETTAFNQDLDFSSESLEAGTTFPYTPASGDDPEQRGITIVGATSVYGTRKAKNFDIQVAVGNCIGPLYFALVYVPQGTIASPMLSTHNSSTLYEPNQNVIASFIVPPPTNNGQLFHFKSRLARNLDSGDSIVLIAYNVYEQSGLVQFAGRVNYAIRY